MRFLLIAFIFSSSAFAACPELTGSYSQCGANEDTVNTPSKIEITQSSRNNITTYNLKITEANGQDILHEVYKTDGKVYTQSTTDPDTGVIILQATTASCVGDALNLKVKLTVDGQVFAEFTNVMRKNKNEFIQTMIGTSVGLPINDIVTCKQL